MAWQLPARLLLLPHSFRKEPMGDKQQQRTHSRPGMLRPDCKYGAH